MRFVLRSKIHKATVTEANLSYIGSITIDEDLIEKAGFWAGEKVLVVSNTSGNRLETYVIAGKKNSGIICMNGASAHLIKKGETLSFASNIPHHFENPSKKIKARCIIVQNPKSY